MTEAAEAEAEVEEASATKRPKSGKTARIWEIADAISAEKGRPALRGEVAAIAKAEGLVDGTISTQYGKWCAFHGLTKEELSKIRTEVKQQEAPEASDASAPEDSDQPTA